MIRCFDNSTAQWQNIGTLQPRTESKKLTYKGWSDFLTALQRDGANPIPPQYDDIAVGEYRLHLR